MTRYERCSNCRKGFFSREPTGMWKRIQLGLSPIFGAPMIHCPDAVDGVVTVREYEQICNIGCAVFEPNLSFGQEKKDG